MRGEQQLLQPGRALEHIAIRHLSARIDRCAAVLRAKRADAIEILERETNRVHSRMAGGACRIRAMLLHLLAHGELFAIFGVLFERGHIGRWRRGRLS